MSKEPPMKINFVVEVSNCWECPYGIRWEGCARDEVNSRNKKEVHEQNRKQLTKTCPMVRAQFEALE
jgi:hypothetical protein